MSSVFEKKKIGYVPWFGSIFCPIDACWLASGYQQYMVALTAIRILSHDHGLPVGSTTANTPRTRNCSSRHKPAADNGSTAQGLGRAWQPTEGIQTHSSPAARPSTCTASVPRKRRRHLRAPIQIVARIAARIVARNALPEIFERPYRSLSNKANFGQHFGNASSSVSVNISGKISGKVGQNFGQNFGHDRAKFRAKFRARSDKISGKNSGTIG